LNIDVRLAFEAVHARCSIFDGGFRQEFVRISEETTADGIDVHQGDKTEKKIEDDTFSSENNYFMSSKSSLYRRTPAWPAGIKELLAR
jgi:hypothetical protein